MKSINRAIAAVQILLIFPAVLFMAALAERAFQPLQNEPVDLAQRIINWYSERLWTLWILLSALPFAVFIIGGVTLLHIWNTGERSQGGNQGTISVAVMTATSAVILVIVGLHTLAN